MNFWEKTLYYVSETSWLVQFKSAPCLETTTEMHSCKILIFILGQREMFWVGGREITGVSSRVTESCLHLIRRKPWVGGFVSPPFSTMSPFISHCGVCHFLSGVNSFLPHYGSTADLDIVSFLGRVASRAMSLWVTSALCLPRAQTCSSKWE